MPASNVQYLGAQFVTSLVKVAVLGGGGSLLAYALIIYPYSYSKYTNNILIAYMCLIFSI